MASKNLPINGTILVVDDEQELREIIAFKCQKLNFATVEATNGAQALALLSDMDTGRKIDIILSDMVMPKIDGFELLRQCRLRNYHQPLIILTGKPSPKILSQALCAGAFDYVKKPFMSDDINALLHNALSESLRVRHEMKVALLNPKILPIKTDLEGFQHIDFTEDSLQKFLELTTNQLHFAKTAVKGLLLGTANKKHGVMVLFRIAREITLRGFHLGLFHIGDFSSHIMICLNFYRANPESIPVEHCRILGDAFLDLQKLIDTASEQRTLSHERVYELKMALFSHSA